MLPEIDGKQFNDAARTVIPEPFFLNMFHCVSYRKQSFILQSKTNDWFLYETRLLEAKNIVGMCI